MTELIVFRGLQGLAGGVFTSTVFTVISQIFPPAERGRIQGVRRQGGGGAIVNMASVNSFYAEGGIAAYCASKGGVQQLTRSMAIDHSVEGIRINCICPAGSRRR
jgi:NAD(P)-dependent dehydrogenase (short-subunit alcohol dehydrogenase family)